MSQIIDTEQQFCVDRPAVLRDGEIGRPVPLALRILNALLKMTGATEVEGLSEAQLIAAQRPLKRNALVNLISGAMAHGVSTRDVSIPLEGHEVAARIYEQSDECGEIRPAVLYMHGGGWASGDIELTDWWCSEFAAKTGAVVMSLGYRLAPQNPFPAALDDCYGALCWLSACSEAMNININRICVAGDSAGANLAAALCFHARSLGGPHIDTQMLIYPALDLTFGSPSIKELAEAPLLSEKAVKAYAQLYLGKSNVASDPLISPLLASDFLDLPRALIQVAEHDPLRDDGWRYATHLESAGVPVRITEYAGATHGFINVPGLTSVAQQALNEACVFFR